MNSFRIAEFDERKGVNIQGKMKTSGYNSDGDWIRPFKVSDSDASRDSELNGQYDYPEIEGPEAMKRGFEVPGSGLSGRRRGGATGRTGKGHLRRRSRTIHPLSVHPGHQHRGMGRALAAAINKEFHRRGSPGTTVAVLERSVPFWEKVGFARLPVCTDAHQMVRRAGRNGPAFSPSREALQILQSYVAFLFAASNRSVDKIPKALVLR